MTGSSLMIDRYKYALLIGVLLLAAAVLYSFAVSRTVARRTKKLVEVIDEKSELEKTARIDRERLSQLERAGFVSEISSMIAHELRQPVASLINYADGLSLYLGGRGKDPVIDEATREITKQAERVASIVDPCGPMRRTVRRHINRWICATSSSMPSVPSDQGATLPVSASSPRFRQKRLFRATPWSLSSSWSIVSKTPFRRFGRTPTARERFIFR